MASKPFMRCKTSHCTAYDGAAAELYTFSRLAIGGVL